MGWFEASDGAHLGYQDLGSGEPMLLVHGWMASSRVWSPLLERLSGRRLLLPDLRGAGSSAGVQHGIGLEQLSLDCLTLLTQLGVEKVDVVGHSMGGQVAMLLAARAPDRVRSLVLLNPVPMEGLALPPDVAAAFRGAGGDSRALGGILDAACRALPAQSRTTLVAEALGIDKACIAEGLSAFTAGGTVECLRDIRCPTTVVATDDPFLPAALLQRSLVDRIAGARLEVLKGPGHYPQWEAPEALTALILGATARRAA